MMRAVTIIFRWYCFGLIDRHWYNSALSTAPARSAEDIVTQPETLEETITRKLAAQFDPAHLEVVNESSGHNVPAGSETHFKVVLVSDSFRDLARIARHRAVHQLLAQELAAGVHALALHLYTAEEWRARFADAPMSPPCLGGKALEDAAT
jgi:BolA protein